MKARVKQFIYSKRIGEPRAIFEPVAWSPNLDLETIANIYNKQTDCRPSQFSFNDYPGSYVIRHTENNDLMLVRFSRSAEGETGSNFFLHEHYVLVDKETAISFGPKIAILLEQIPAAEAFYDYDRNLPELIDLPEKLPSFHELLALSTSNDANQQMFQLSILSTLDYFLDAVPTLVVLSNTPSQIHRWAWFRAFLRVLPKSGLANMSIFIGESAPNSWTPSLAIVNNKGTTRGYVVLDTNEGGANFKGLLDHKPATYSNLVADCFSQARGEFFKELLDMVGGRTSKLGNQALRNQSLDEHLGNLAMPTIGLSLVRTAIRSNKYEIGDISWFWRNAVDLLDQEEIPIFLQLLISEYPDWDKKDFDVLTDLVESEFSAVSKGMNTLQVKYADQYAQFLQNWCNVAGSISDNSALLITQTLTRIVEYEPKSSYRVLLTLLERGPYKQLLSNYLRLFNLLSSQPETVPINLSVIAPKLMLLITNVDDLRAFRGFLRHLPATQRSLFLEEILAHLSNTGSNIPTEAIDHYFEPLKGDHQIQMMQVLLLLSLRLQNENAFASLVLGIIRNKSALLSTALGLADKQFLHQISFSWAISAQDYRFLGLFIALLIKCGHKPLANEIFFQVLSDPQRGEGAAQILDLDTFYRCFQIANEPLQMILIRQKQVGCLILFNQNLAEKYSNKSLRFLESLNLGVVQSTKWKLQSRQFLSRLKKLNITTCSKIIERICRCPHNPRISEEQVSISPKVYEFTERLKSNPGLALFLFADLLMNYSNMIPSGQSLESK